MKAGPGRKELPQESVGVLVRAPLSGARGISKVDPHLRLLREEPMLPHLLALIVREGAAQLSRQRADFIGKGSPHGRRILHRQRHHQCKPGRALHRRPQCRGTGMVHEQIILPMARHRAISHFGGPFVDTHSV